METLTNRFVLGPLVPLGAPDQIYNSSLDSRIIELHQALLDLLAQPLSRAYQQIRQLLSFIFAKTKALFWIKLGLAPHGIPKLDGIGLN